MFKISIANTKCHSLSHKIVGGCQLVKVYKPVNGQELNIFDRSDKLKKFMPIQSTVCWLRIPK